MVVCTTDDSNSDTAQNIATMRKKDDGMVQAELIVKSTFSIRILLHETILNTLCHSIYEKHATVYHSGSWSKCRRRKSSNWKAAALQLAIITIAYYGTFHLVSATGRYTPSAANQTLSGFLSRTPQTWKSCNGHYRMIELFSEAWFPFMMIYSVNWILPLVDLQLCVGISCHDYEGSHQYQYAEA